MPDTPPFENWVSIPEAAEILGYHPTYLRKLAIKFWRTPEDQREVRLIRRSHGYELWLPDLKEYVKNSARGPYGKRNSPDADTPNT